MKRGIGIVAVLLIVLPTGCAGSARYYGPIILAKDIQVMPFEVVTLTPQGTPRQRDIDPVNVQIAKVYENAFKSALQQRGFVVVPAATEDTLSLRTKMAVTPLRAPLSTKQGAFPKGSVIIWMDGYQGGKLVAQLVRATSWSRDLPPRSDYIKRTIMGFFAERIEKRWKL